MSQDLLNQHVKLCQNVDSQRIKMPTEKNNTLKFTNIHKQLRSPFTVYVDFECILKSQEVETSPIGLIEDSESRTTTYQEHILCSYTFKLVSDVTSISLL